MGSPQELAVHSEGTLRFILRHSYVLCLVPNLLALLAFLAAFQQLHALSRAGPRVGSGDHNAAPELFQLILFSSVPRAGFGGALSSVLATLQQWQGGDCRKAAPAFGP